MQVLPSRTIGGFAIIDTSADLLVDTVVDRLRRRERTELVFANTNFILQCFGFRDALNGADTLIANDGIGMDLASMLLFRRRFTANLNGTDFTPRLLRSVTAPTRVFLIGSTSFAVDEAARQWSSLPRIEIVGTLDGFDDLRDDDAVVERLRRAQPDVLLLALGNPHQERWIVSHRGRLDIPLVVGVGALFDFVSGRATRAPSWMQRMHLEWLHRLAREPRRLLKRYSVDLVRFFVHCLRTRRLEVANRATAAR